MNFKLPPGVNPPPFPSVENGYGFRVSRVLNDPYFDHDEAMNAYMKLQRPLIDARRRAMQTEGDAQTV